MQIMGTVGIHVSDSSGESFIPSSAILKIETHKIVMNREQARKQIESVKNKTQSNNDLR